MSVAKLFSPHGNGSSKRIRLEPPPDEVPLGELLVAAFPAFELLELPQAASNKLASTRLAAAVSAAGDHLRQRRAGTGSVTSVFNMLPLLPLWDGMSVCCRCLPPDDHRDHRFVVLLSRLDFADLLALA
jgi:hypothetical protein